MVKVDYKQAREFLERINSEDRVAIYTHIDSDGLASGVLLEDFCKKKKCNNVEVFFLDYYIGEKIPHLNPSRFNKFLIADLAPSAIAKDLYLLEHGETFYTDHHQEDLSNPVRSEKILELRTTSEGYIPSSRTVYELTEKENKEKLWLATLGILSDRGDKYSPNDVFLDEAYKNLNSTHQEMKEYTRKLENLIVFFSSDLNMAHQKLSRVRSLEEMDSLAPFYEPVEQEMARLIGDYMVKREKSGEKIIYHLTTKFPPIKSPMINRISAANGLNVLVFYGDKNNGELSVSARNHGKIYDVSLVLKDCIQGLDRGITGGHPFAAAGSIRQEDLDEFKLRFKQYDLEKARIKNDK